ncbi:MAG: glycoside hydrolase family 16 protein [Oscillospiraceae bacterium]|jgi:hypothetical protein|nr:glycoside hydrolase family 16 protein [Oscillospiraceae bacterium]
MKITIRVYSLVLSFFVMLWQLISVGVYLIPRTWHDTAWPAAAAPTSVYPTQAEAQAAGGGWYVTMDESFAGNTLPAPWVPSPHGLRNTEYWCDNMVDATEDGTVKILAAQLTDNVCGVCPAAGDFTSGIETRKMVDGKSTSTFEQAFGYYEARVWLPEGPGLWAAFWLQANAQGRIGSYGKDGTEVDVFESAFRYEPTMVGNAFHWDGYDLFYGTTGHVTDTKTDQYGGWHTYGLLWTPENYTFFVDGKATWQSDAGGVSRVPEFLRLTVEIRRAETGPYGAKLGAFQNTRENPSVFKIDYVKVYQNTAFLDEIRAPEDFKELPVPAILTWFQK